MPPKNHEICGLKLEHLIEQLRQLFQHRRGAGQEGNAGLCGGGLQGLVLRGGEGQDRNVAGGGSFFDEGDASAGLGSAGDFGQKDEGLCALALLLKRGGMVDGLDAIAQVLQTDGQLTAEQWIGTAQ